TFFGQAGLGRKAGLALSAGGSDTAAVGGGILEFEHDYAAVRASGPELFDHGAAVARSLGAAVEAVDYIVPHQASGRMAERLGSRLGLESRRVFVNADRVGNTGSAAIWLASPSCGGGSSPSPAFWYSARKPRSSCSAGSRMFTADAVHGNGGSGNGPRGCVVEVEDLAKRYGGRVALEHVSVALGPGEILGLVGGNGSGKTTTLRILAGLLAPDAGHGVVVGLDLRRDMREIRRHVGYMSQRLSLDAELSVTETLRFRAQVYGDRRPRAVAEAAMEAFELTSYARTPAGHLSGGWARRLQLAASMIHRPRLLLLDEPTAGLDVLSRQEVW